MAFWDFLKGKQDKTIELQLDQVPEFVEKSVLGRRKQLDEIIAKKFSEIKFVLGQMRLSLDDLEKKPLESENVRLNKIVGTARIQTITRFSSLLSKLEPPSPNELDSVKRYCIESNEFLKKEIEQGGKSIAYTGFYLKEPVKQIGQGVKELGQQFSFLNNQISEFAAVFLQASIEDLLKEIGEKSKAITLLESDVGKAEQAIVAAQKSKTSVQSEISSLKKSEAFGLIAKLNEKKALIAKEKQDKKTELVSLLGSIDKPLKRLAKAVESDRINLPSNIRETMIEMRRNPLHLLKKDPKGESVKVLLQELKNVIKSGAVELKDREKIKRLAALDELLAFNFFSNVFWKLNELDSGLQQVEKELHENKAAGELTQLESNAKTADKAIQEAGFSLETLKGQLEKEHEELASIRQSIEVMLQEIYPATIVLK
tara:strand:+ start:4340 stop:5623 length:1284 start_codon:yes stop_codon:yes gene_type:complete